MSDALKALADLKTAYAAAETLDDYAALWDILRRVESAVTNSANADTQELQALEGLKSVVSGAIRNCREGLNQPTNISMKIGALENAIMRNTTGPDGWPMAKR